MRKSHTLGRIRDKVASNERVLHTLMSHGDTVANGDSREYNGVAACHCNACLNGVNDFVYVHMTGYNLVIRAYNTDKRLAQLLVRHTQRVQKGTLRGALCALPYCVTNHYNQSFQLLFYFVIKNI